MHTKKKKVGHEFERWQVYWPQNQINILYLRREYCNPNSVYILHSITERFGLEGDLEDDLNPTHPSTMGRETFKAFGSCLSSTAPVPVLAVYLLPCSPTPGHDFRAKPWACLVPVGLVWQSLDSLLTLVTVTGLALYSVSLGVTNKSFQLASLLNSLRSYKD